MSRHLLAVVSFAVGLGCALAIVALEAPPFDELWIHGGAQLGVLALALCAVPGR